MARNLAWRVEWPELSPREAEILALMTRGKSDLKIAALAFIGQDRVKFHVTHILDEPGTASRGGFIAVATKRGLVWEA